MASQKQLGPFRFNTGRRRQLNQDDNTKAFAVGGSPVNFSIDKVGFLAGFILKVYGSVTLSSAGALADLGAANLVRNVKVTLLNGNITVVDLSGYHLSLINGMLFRGFGNNGQGGYTPSPAVQSSPVASGANTWVQHWYIPLSANFGSAFDTGIINAQSSQNTISLQVTPASAGSDFVTNFSSASLIAEIENVYYDVPNPANVRWPLNQLVRRIQSTENITATGDTKHEIERQGILMQALGVVRCNGARSNSLDRLTIRTNNSNYIIVDPPSYNQFIYEGNYSKPAQTGVYVMDFWHSGEDPSSYDLRDVINTEYYTKTEYSASVAAGTTLGSGNNFFDITEVRLVNLTR